MPQVIVTERAAEGLERCRQFLTVKSRDVAKKAAQAIEKQFLLLETSPGIGRPIPDRPHLHELTIAFGDSGYVALYRYEPTSDTQFILAF